MSWEVIGEVTVGVLLGRLIQLIVVKAFIEPLAIRLGQSAYRRVDAASGDRLPDLFPPKS